MQSSLINKKVIILGLIILLLSELAILHISSNKKPKRIHWQDNVATIVSVSSDGQYAVTSHLNRQLVLWNLKNKTHKIIVKNANIYSAYFVKNSRDFMWQNDDSDVVYISNINGKIIKTLSPGFPTYGEVITTNLKNYFASDEAWDIYSIHDQKKIIVKKGLFSPDFLGSEKLLNLSLSRNNKILLSSGDSCTEADSVPIKYGQGTAGNAHWSRSLMAGIVTWSVKTGRPLHKHPGNGSKTVATFSTDGKYITGGDEGGNTFLWHTAGKLKFELDDVYFGHLVKLKNGKEEWIKTGLIPEPKDFYAYHNYNHMHGADTPAVLALKFIDQTHYLRFTTYIPYVILYSVNSPQPLKYIKIAPHVDQVDFTKNHYPAIDQYTRDEAIDTAPKAHILVMGQRKGNGIIVYKYDPKKQTLKKIWVGNF